MTDTWFVMIPPSYSSQSAAEKELVDFRVQYAAGSQAWADASAGKILSASESGEGQQLVRWQGPFATEAEAQAAQNPQQQSLNPVNDLVNAAETSNTLSSATSILGFLKGLFTRKNAVRFAEGTLGLALVLVAVAELAKGTPVGNAVKKVPFI
jgi:hypothetical protein